MIWRPFIEPGLEVDMSLTQWIGIGAGALVIAFMAFAFLQGMKVKPEDRDGRGGLPPGYMN